MKKKLFLTSLLTLAVALCNPVITPVVAAETGETVLSTKIELNQTTLSLAEGRGASVEVYFTPEDTTDQTFTADSSDEKVATVDANGRISAVGYGSCTVTYTSGDGKSTADCTVNVYCTEFSLEDKSVVAGSQTTLTPAFKNNYKGIGNDKIAWSSSNNNIASVDSNGVVTAKANGTVDITGILLTSNNSGAINNVSATCTFTVKKLVEEIKTGKDSFTLYGGQTAQIVAEVLPEDANDTSLTFTSDKEFVKVNERGFIETSADGDGTAIITISTKDGSNIKKEVKVTVIPTIKKISFGKDTYTVTEGESLEIPVSIDTVNKNFKRYITVDKNAHGVVTNSFITKENKNYLKITGIAPGETDIEFYSATNPDVSAKIHVVVQKKVVTEQPKDESKGDPKDEPKEEIKDSIITIKNATFKVYKKDAYASLTKVNTSASGTLTIPSSIIIDNVKYPVTKIETGAFKNIKKVTSITIPSSVTEIGDYAFQNCSKLKSIIIPAKVTTIGKKAFYNCKAIKNVTIKGTKVKSIGASAFKKINKTAVIKVPSKKYSSYKKLLKGKVDTTTKIKK